LADSAKRLALGTAQLGLDYGVANRVGVVPDGQVKEILAVAEACGIDTVDTAMAYGNAEERLGRAGVAGLKIVTKLPAIPEDCSEIAEWTSRLVQRSLSQLRVDRLYAILFHRPGDLLGTHGTELFNAVEMLRDQKVVSRIGVSIYDPGELDSIVGRFPIDLVQAPFNVVDRRLAGSGWMNRLADAGAELHARSVFLQGLLVMEPRQRPERFDRWRQLWASWDGWLERSGLTAVEACLGFALSFPQVSRVVVGVESSGQLAELADAAGVDAPDLPASIACHDLDLINPSRW
jgi:aryl-alcohol dehydrogenase-like predicted oxidoreductase